MEIINKGVLPEGDSLIRKIKNYSSVYTKVCR